MQEVPVLHPKKENQGIPKAAKIVAGVAVAGVAGGIGAVTINNAFSDEGQDSEHIQTIPTSEQPALIPGTEIPNPLLPPIVESSSHVGFKLLPSNDYAYLTKEGSEIAIPNIDGLYYRFVADPEDSHSSGKVLYFASENNKYGIEQNLPVGEFKGNVEFNKVQRGGIILDSRIVEELIKKENSQDPSKINWVLPIPVDISGLSDDDLISLVNQTSASNPLANVVKVNFRGNASVLNVSPGESNLLVVMSGRYGLGFLNKMRTVAPNHETIEPGNEQQYFGVYGELEGVNEGESIIDVNFGDKISDSNGTVTITRTTSKEVFDISPEKILDVLGVPVFVSANKR